MVRYSVSSGGHENRHIFIGRELPGAGNYDRTHEPVAWMEKNPFFKGTREAKAHEAKMIELARIMAAALTAAQAEPFRMPQPAEA